MSENIKYKLDREDTTELFATLIGYVIFNHEKLNFEIIAAIEIIERKLNYWRNWTEGHYSSENDYNPVKSFTKQLPDSELRNLFGNCINVFCEVQQKLAEIPDWFNKVPEIMLQCLKDENQLRNYLVHSGFNFTEENVAHEQITTKRRIRNSGKRKGSYEINVIDRDIIIEFLEYQTKLIKFLADFTANETEPDFYCDYSRVVLNSDRFEEKYVNYASHMLPADVHNPDDLEFMRQEYLEDHETVLNDWKSFSDDLMKIDYIRKNLKIKSKNVEYKSHIFEIY